MERKPKQKADVNKMAAVAVENNRRHSNLEERKLRNDRLERGVSVEKEEDSEDEQIERLDERKQEEEEWEEKARNKNLLAHSSCNTSLDVEEDMLTTGGQPYSSQVPSVLC